MSWKIVAVVAILSVSICKCANITAIKWMSNVNSHKSLEEAFKSDVKGIVADVVMGYHQPVMHQKSMYSDFSFVQFITEAIQYQNNNTQNIKIIKLNFHSMTPVEESITILLIKHREIKFSLWLNANILVGPGDNASRPSVDGNQFIEQVKKMHNVVLSIGWTTKTSNDVYNKLHTDAMEKILSKNHLNTTDYKDLTINFPIRAYNALQSQDVLKKFYDHVKETNPVAYTVQSEKGDVVNTTELQQFIESYGVENIYIDLPDELRNQLHLGNGASSLVRFGLLNLITLVIVTVFRN